VMDPSYVGIWYLVFSIAAMFRCNR